MCHIPYIHSIAEGIKLILKPGGMLVYEDPYLGDIITKTSYDQIYDEHAFYFSLMSVQNLFGRHNLEVFDLAPQNVHGGSMRYYIGHKDAHTISDNVRALLEKEKVNRKQFLALMEGKSIDEIAFEGSGIFGDYDDENEIKDTESVKESNSEGTEILSDVNDSDADKDNDDGKVKF